MTRRPFGEFDHLQQQIEDMWERLTGQGGRSRFCPPILEPPVDIYETAENVVLVAEIAGIGGEEVQIDVLGGRLRFHGRKDDRHAAVDHRHSQMEICYGAFDRTVSLPAEVDAEAVDVSYENGFLRIVLPKRQQRTHQVRVIVRAQEA